MTFIVHSGEYPFDKVLGMVEASTAEEALTKALNEHGNHCVVSPSQGDSAGTH